MKLSELLNCPPIHEDYADAIPDQMPDFDPRHAKVIGNNDGRDVWGSRCWKSIDVYAYRTGNRVDAFIAVSPKKNKNDQYPLVRSWCNPSLRGRGLVSSLLGFVTKKMGNKLIVKNKEPLTKDGLDWLIKLINRPNGFHIHDGKGNKLDPAKVKADWEAARNSSKGKKLQLVIENDRRIPIWGEHWPMLDSVQHLNCDYLD